MGSSNCKKEPQSQTDIIKEQTFCNYPSRQEGIKKLAKKNADSIILEQDDSKVDLFQMKQYTPPEPETAKLPHQEEEQNEEYRQVNVLATSRQVISDTLEPTYKIEKSVEMVNALDGMYTQFTQGMNEQASIYTKSIKNLEYGQSPPQNQNQNWQHKIIHDNFEDYQEQDWASVVFDLGISDNKIRQRIIIAQQFGKYKKPQQLQQHF